MTAQACNRKGQPDRAVLEHARALLLALAVLVERAAGLPAARRLWFLAVMAGGEAEARRLIVAMASDRCPGMPAGFDAAPTEASAPPFRASHPWPSTPAEATTGASTLVGDAALLAARFRVLALALGALLAQARGHAPCRHASPPFLLPGRKPRRSEGWRAVPELPAPDT